MWSKTVKVPAMDCVHCEHTIKREVGEVAGVKEVKADWQAQTVVLVLEDENRWPAVKAFMEEIGYAPEEN